MRYFQDFYYMLWIVNQNSALCGFWNTLPIHGFISLLIDEWTDLYKMRSLEIFIFIIVIDYLYIFNNGPPFILNFFPFFNLY